MTCCITTSSAVFDGCRQVSRAAIEACCTSLPGFSRDKRGRLQEIFANIVNCIPLFQNFGSLHFSAGPAQWSCDGTGPRAAGALRILTARTALPDPACVITLDDWLPRSIVQSFNDHAATDQPNSSSFFNGSMHQWRSVVRRMVRCKLAVALPSDAEPVRVAAGAFALPKDRDRLICDRRPQNSQDSAVNRVLLPFCPRLRRLILQRSQALGVHIFDTRAFPYIKVTGLVGTHGSWVLPSPPSWLHHIEDDTNDDIGDDNLGTWWEADLRQSSDNDEPYDGYRQIAIVGVMMEGQAHQRGSAPH